MNRPLIALAAVLLVLGSIARLTCAGDRAPLATPDAPLAAEQPDVQADLVEPRGTADERSTAAAAPPTANDEASAIEEEADPEPPVLLNGLVIDGRGVGIPDATVRLERRIVDTGGFGMRSVQIMRLSELTTRTDDEGRFEVRGEEVGEVVVLAEKKGHVLDDEVECELPATRVTLVLERAGAILATVASDESELADEVHVEVRSPGVEHDIAHAVGNFRAGRALRQKLLPGNYDVVLVGRLSRRVLHTVPGVQVRPGETTEDPRLQELDLSALLDKIRITVIDPDDRPMTGVTVWVHHGFGEIGTTTNEEGSIELGAGTDGVDVAVREEGWRHVQHVGVAEDLVIRLERPLAVRLVRPAGRSAELGSLYLYVEPVLPGGDSRGVAGNRDWTLPAEEDAVEVELSAPGTYRVLWAAMVSFEGRGMSNIYPRGVEPQVFEMPEGAGTIDVTLTLDPDAVDALLARVSSLADELKKQPGESDDEHERRVMEVLMHEYRSR